MESGDFRNLHSPIFTLHAFLLWCGSTQNASPGGKLSEKRSQRTVFLTEEECGRKSGIREMLGLPMCFVEIQTYFRSISYTNFQVTARIPTLAKSRLRRLLAARACGRSLPTRFFRTSFGRATLPPGEGISLRRNFFDKLQDPDHSVRAFLRAMPADKLSDILRIDSRVELAWTSMAVVEG